MLLTLAILLAVALWLMYLLYEAFKEDRGLRSLEYAQSEYEFETTGART